MANQFLYGDPCPVEVPWAAPTTDATITFAVGDLLKASSGTAVVNGTSTVTTDFLGIAAQKKPTGITGTSLRLLGNSTDGVIRVNTGGVWSLDRSDTVALVVGDFIGPTATTTVAKVGDESISIGVVVKAAAGGSTKCIARLHSAVIPAAKAVP